MRLVAAPRNKVSPVYYTSGLSVLEAPCSSRPSRSATSASPSLPYAFRALGGLLADVLARGMTAFALALSSEDKELELELSTLSSDELEEALLGSELDKLTASKLVVPGGASFLVSVTGESGLDELSFVGISSGNSSSYSMGSKLWLLL